MRRQLLALLLLPPVLAAPFRFAPDREDEPALSFERFHAPDEVAERFELLAARHPRWFRAQTLGRSVQDRALPLLAISDFESTSAKVGAWVDGAIHGGELAAAEPPLALVEHLRAAIVKGSPPAWLDGVVLYVVPVINVDGRHLALQAPYPDQRRNLHPVDDDGDGQFDEDGPVDLNGDGRLSRIVVGGERPFEARDADGDGRCGEDPPGGVDLNRNFPVGRAERPEGWSPEPEVAAIVAFWERHPEIALAFSYHTSANVLVWPPAAPGQRDLEPMRRVSRLYREHLRGQVWESQKALEALVGTSMEWFHVERGALAFTVEMAGRPTTTDAPEPDRQHDVVLHPCAGEVVVERIEQGYSSELQTRMERQLPLLLPGHVAFLLAALEDLAAGHAAATPR